MHELTVQEMDARPWSMPDATVPGYLWRSGIRWQGATQVGLMRERLWPGANGSGDGDAERYYVNLSRQWDSGWTMHWNSGIRRGTEENVNASARYETSVVSALRIREGAMLQWRYDYAAPSVTDVMARDRAAEQGVRMQVKFKW